MEQQLRQHFPEESGRSLNRLGRFTRGLGLLGLSLGSLIGCTTPPDEWISETPCHTATALATYGWEVAYFPERFRNDANRHRIETFASAELLNRNGIQPEGRVIGPDDEGVWWPLLPPRPTADEMDDRRDDDFRYNDPPLLQHTVRYRLECEAGQFATTDEQYRRLGRALREGKAVLARHSLGQLLDARVIEPPGVPQGN